MRGRATLLLLAIAATSCPAPEPRPPVPFALTIATRQSCGILSGLDYDTSCLSALNLRVRDATRNIVFETCRPIGDVDGGLETFDQLRDIVNREAPVFEFTRLQSTGTVTFELIGLHSKVEDAAANPCSGTPDPDAFLFFGESAPVDLTQYDDGAGPPLVEIALDCRDCTFNDDSCTGAQQCRFGCTGIAPAPNPAICPADFPASFCVPNAGCAKPCDEPADCFEGQQECGASGFCETATNGALCSPCSEVIGCGDGLVCVRKPSGGGSFCALPCPDAPCPSGTKCNRIGNDLVLGT